MIVKNEQDTLERCLESVRGIADEIVIVDTGSTDRTKEIAGKWTDKVIDYIWIDDFAAARNFSFAQATMDYILWLDADDVLLPEDREKLLRLKQTLDPVIDAVSMEYHAAFDPHGNVSIKLRCFRLVKRSKQFQWQGVVHEDLIVKGHFIDSDIVVTHRQAHGVSDRNLKIYEKRRRENKEFTTRDLMHYAMELHFHKMPDKALGIYLQLMDRPDITAEDMILICMNAADCYSQQGNEEKEWELMCKTLQYGTPRADFCCRLGLRLFGKKKYREAIFWFKLALKLPLPQSNWGLQNEAFQTWMPHIQLSLCYHRLGEYELAYHHTKVAISYRPGDEQLQKNLSALEQLLNQKG
jgi:glycosyltransferase involved in cell wall biosynthesis